MVINRYSIINHLFSKYNMKDSHYLEIGVWTGATFKKVNSKYKDGVDPGQYGDYDCVNYKMTSDEFFSKHTTKKYDFIFIDGLHTAHQVSKDIFNSIEHLNDGGVIMLDDVYPHNKNEQYALDLNKVGAQTGDVWKAVYHILDTIKSISSEILFVKDTERGNLIFKIKKNNTTNIVIDPTIPTKNIDGWYKGNDKEWDKYEYDKDFKIYYNIISNYQYNI